jgi:hypothetical protein
MVPVVVEEDTMAQVELVVLPGVVERELVQV